jgi:hypothetical protein
MKQKIILSLIALLMLSTLALTVNASYTYGEGIDGYVYRCGVPAEGIVVRVYNRFGMLEGYGVIPGDPPTQGELGTSITDANGYYHVAWLAGHSENYTVIAETQLGNIIGTAEVLYLGCGETRRVDFCYCPGAEPYTIGYWKNHLEDWPVTSLTIGGVTYDQNGLLDILRNARAKDATYMLAAQLVGAKLNVANGADSSSISGTITEADNFLATHPIGSNPRNADRDYALTLKDALDDFNNGY